LSTTKAPLPTLKREAVTLDEEGEVVKNALGEVMSMPVANITSHWDADAPDVEVELSQRATGYPYGSDLIPIGPLEMEGLKFRSPPRVTILGYTPVESIPMSVWMGPTRIISGNVSSRKSCLAISALSQALHRLNTMAYCTYVKSKDSDPIMGVLAPLVEDDPDMAGQPKPRHLLYVPMPFADDAENLKTNPLEDEVGDDKAQQACDDLIDAFMLPPKALDSQNIPNPALRSFRKTIIRRAMDPSFNGIIAARNNDDDVEDAGPCEDPMATPLDLLAQGKEQLKKFRDVFPLEVVEKITNGKRKKKYFVPDDSQESF